jgi:hypothetical protein
MEYAQITNGEALQITTHGNVEWDANNFCSAEALTRDGKAEQFNVVPLRVIEPPACNPITQTAVRNGCELVGGVWQYKWDVVERFATQAERDAAIAAAQPDWRTPLMVELRAKRDTLLNVLDGIQADALTSSNTTDALACKNIKAALKLVPELSSVTGAADAAAFKVAVVTAYKTAITGAPMGVLVLFAGYLK